MKKLTEKRKEKEEKTKLIATNSIVFLGFLAYSLQIPIQATVSNITLCVYEYVYIHVLHLLWTTLEFYLSKQEHPKPKNCISTLEDDG